jgi:hypothetical protein
MNEPYSIKGTLVKDHIHHKSYNMTSKIDAENLYNTLTTYHKIHILNKNIETQYDNITKQIIQLQLSVKILEHEINTLQEVVTKCKSQ